jgi:hypothetical protein
MKTIELFDSINCQIKLQIDKVKEGEMNPFELGRHLKLLEKTIKDVYKPILDPYEKSEFDKYPKEQLQEMKISLSAGGYSYDFKHIPEWVEKKKELSAIEEKAKSAFLANESTKIEIDKFTGEVLNDFEGITPAIGKAKKQSVVYK